VVAVVAGREREAKPTPAQFHTSRSDHTLRKTTFTLLLGALAAITLITASAADAATTVRVDGDGQAGWLFNRDTTTTTPYTFTTADHSIGNGSIYVLPIGSNPSDKFIAEQFLATPVNQVQSIAYDFKVAGNGTAADGDQFYLNVYANIDNSDNFYDCRFDYVPTTGSTTAWTTASFSATDTPVNVRQRGTRIGAPGSCPTTLAGMPAGSYVHFFSLSVGDTTASDAGLAGFYDKVVVNLTGGTTVYDFEASPSSKDACKNGGWVAFGFKNQGDCIQFVNTGK